ncbi:MAG TPA: HtaA domain-containing protein [Solirubrobacterales bacterium]|jgi:hypothetical protein|nr:HtaA domain-containing protein [Solirubrobacterales bacterium]
MSTLPNPSLRHPRALAVLALALAAIIAATATSASAAPASGEVVLTLKKGAKSSLLREGVKASPRSGKGATQTVKLPVSDLELGAASLVKTGATLTLSGGGKSAKLKDVELKIGATSTAISAKLGGKSQVFFRAGAEAQTVGTAVVVKGPLTLTGSGARALREALGLDGISGGRVGSANVAAAISAATPVTPAPKQPDAPVDPYPYATQCPVASVAGAPGGAGEAPGTVDGIAAAPIFNAGTSQEVTGTEVDWGFRSDFRGYVLGSPPPGSLQPLDGAEAKPTGSGMADPDSFFSFPASGGSYERGTAADFSDDKLVVNGTGTVLFCKSDHGFDVVLKNPTVTIDGANSRITADLGANFNGTWHPFQRVDVADLDLDGVTPTIGDGGTTIAWDEIPATLTADGAKASGLSGFYSAGETLDPITVKTSLQRPILAGCTIDAGTAAAAAVAFAPDVLPTLTSPVIRSGKNLGTINWGFRRSPRATTFTGGGANAFQLLGGASEGFPGAMGGGNALPPGGGLGKFFRFPIASYQYEAGTADPADDRLIATSNATVGFCNINQGNFGLIISKPTLVIDGANSRIIANAYSFAGSFMGGPVGGWAGGRVKVVNLNTTGINANPGVGTVRWGEVNPDFEPIQNGIPVAGGLQTEAFSKLGLTIASTAGGGMDPVAAQIVLPTP